MIRPEHPEFAQAEQTNASIPTPCLSQPFELGPLLVIQARRCAEKGFYKVTKADHGRSVVSPRWWAHDARAPWPPDPVQSILSSGQSYRHIGDVPSSRFLRLTVKMKLIGADTLSISALTRWTISSVATSGAPGDVAFEPPTSPSGVVGQLALIADRVRPKGRRAGRSVWDPTGHTAWETAARNRPTSVDVFPSFGRFSGPPG